MPRKLIDPKTVFGRLTVCGFAEPIRVKNGDRLSASNCQCECGVSVVVANMRLRNGNTRSCGCLQRKTASDMLTTHGHTSNGKTTSEFRAWCHMIDRTTNANNKSWDMYGGRGITMCERWRDFENFLADIGPKPSPQHSIDRIDNNGNYTPENCRWATASQQNNNTRGNVRFTFYGKDRTVAEWSKITLVPVGAIHKRLKLNWPPRFAIWAPAHSQLKTLKSRCPHHVPAGVN